MPRGVLRIASRHRHQHLVLGALGCGLFRNDSVDVAEIFEELLCGAGLFRNTFRAVVFAVLDRTAKRATIPPFQTTFRGRGGRRDSARGDEPEGETLTPQSESGG